MPLPLPSKNQHEDEFISECMGDEMMKKDFKDNKQRLAVCYSQFKKKKSDSTTWPEHKKETKIFY